jgi:hypothetical protein
MVSFEDKLNQLIFYHINHITTGRDGRDAGVRWLSFSSVGRRLMEGLRIED